MTRYALLLVLAACGPAHRPASKLFANGAGECPDPRGCEAPTEEEGRFKPPDEGHPPPEEVLVPLKMRDATCADVGASLAAFEVGNYAEPEERAPVVAKHQARCVKAKLSRDDRQCVFEAADQATMAYCAPALFPELPIQIVDARECLLIANQIHELMKALPQKQSGNQFWARRIVVLLESCREDRWTMQYGECARTSPMAVHPTVYCSHVAPAPLRKKLEDRLAKLR